MSKTGRDALDAAKSFVADGNAEDAILRALALIARLDARLDIVLGEHDPKDADLIAEAERVFGMPPGAGRRLT